MISTFGEIREYRRLLPKSLYLLPVMYMQTHLHRIVQIPYKKHQIFDVALRFTKPKPINTIVAPAANLIPSDDKIFSPGTQASTPYRPPNIAKQADVIFCTENQRTLRQPTSESSRKFIKIPCLCTQPAYAPR